MQTFVTFCNTGSSLEAQRTSEKVIALGILFAIIELIKKSVLIYSLFLVNGKGCLDKISAGLSSPLICFIVKSYDCNSIAHFKICAEGFPLCV